MDTSQARIVRTHRLVARLEEDLWEFLTRMASGSRISRSQYVRQLVLEAKRRDDLARTNGVASPANPPE